MTPLASTTRAERTAAHRQKMQRKAAARARLYAERGAVIANHLTKRDRSGKVTTILRVPPNSGRSNSIWPKGKVAKPGRMG